MANISPRNASPGSKISRASPMLSECLQMMDTTRALTGVLVNSSDVFITSRSWAELKVLVPDIVTADSQHGHPQGIEADSEAFARFGAAVQDEGANVRMQKCVQDIVRQGAGTDAATYSTTSSVSKPVSGGVGINSQDVTAPA
jgi:hypothetical protein